MRSLYGIVFIAFSSFASANGLNTLEFTQAYVNCVKSFESESDFSETAGKADSGLMNGQVLNGNIGANYWSFMNCITPAVSGTLSTSVPTVNGCAPEVKNLTTPDIQVYLPFKKEGSFINVNGHEFSCSSGTWNFLSSTGQERRRGCAAQTVMVEACTYAVPVLEHNKGGFFENITAGKRGSVLGVCNDSYVDISSATCEVSDCEVGERVTWSESAGGEVFFCEGNVAANGATFSSLANIQYFSTETSARTSSIVPTGTAQYICRDGRWDRVEGVGSCRYKSPAEKVCNEINIGNATDHFCQ